MPAPLAWQRLDTTAPLWTLERCDAAGWSLRSFALELAPGRLLVVSPMRSLPEEAFTGLAALGAPQALLAPNHFHNLGLAEWHGRFPAARLVAADGALPRLRERVAVPFDGLAAVEGALPGGVRLLVPQGTKTGEAWLRLEGGEGVTWVVCDAFFNQVERVAGLEGVVVRVLGVAPGLRLGGTFKLLALADRRTYLAWLLRQLDADRPTGLVVGHGAPLREAGLAERLRALAKARLG